MTKKEQETITLVCKTIEHIIDFDNKNLKNKQFYDLDECVDLLKALLGKKPNEII